MDITFEMLKDALGMFLFLGAELSILFLVISWLVSILQQYIPQDKIEKILSGKQGSGYLFAVLLGAITPFCSCSTIPMLRGLLKAKAGFGPVMTFLFVSPLLNPIIIGLFFVTFGIKVTLIYSLIALVVSVISGIILAALHFERFIIPEKTDVKSCCCCSAPKPAPKATACGCGCGNIKRQDVSPFFYKAKQANKEAWVQFKSVFWYLLLGVSLGAFVYGFVPSEFIAQYASGNSLWAVPVAAVIGIPLYVRMEVLIPLSAMLIGKGMNLGAVMALLIGGSGASITELILLKSMFKLPMLLAFLVVILGMAVFCGYFFQFIF